MSLALEQTEYPPVMPAALKHRAVIIGNGPIGMRTASLLLQQNPDVQVILYGDEPHEPYNRVRLSSVLAGQLDWQALASDLDEQDPARLLRRYGCRVVSLDPRRKLLLDSNGQEQSFDTLVFATGSRPRIPNIPGIRKPGVFTFRDLADVSALMARQARSRRTVVLGGGLLGLETARAMQRQRTEVIVIEHNARLLLRQLDDHASQLLEQHLRAENLQLIVGNGVAEVLGERQIEGLRLQSGEQIVCDTLIVAAGIEPNIELARDAGIPFGKGIRVNDAMETAVPGVYAVGECAEHRGNVYGIVAPGLEQAGVAAHNILGGDSRYRGSIAATRLKVLDLDVFSSGPMGDDASPGFGREYVYRDGDQGIYRKLLIHRNRLAGAICLGPWEELNRLQVSLAERQLIMPWHLLRFRRDGRLWNEDETQSVTRWPASVAVCQCTGATRGRITEAIAAGADSVTNVGCATGAGTVCGSCRPLVQELLGDAAPKEPNDNARTLVTCAILGFLLVLAFLTPLEIPYADTVQVDIPWDQLWRDGLLKQITGFSMLGLTCIGLLLSLRKRISSLHHIGKFSGWRVLHLVLAVGTLVMLVAHTGLRPGTGLNTWLMLCFVAMALLGAFNAGVLGLEHRLDTGLASRLRRQSLWLHILLFWPVPVLLTFHVLKGYWF